MQAPAQAFTAGGLASFYGTVAAPTITVTSGDIYIDAAGALGVAGLTDLIIFNAVSAGDILLGAGTTTGYHLDEDGDIFADSVVFNAVNGNDVVVGDIAIDGSQTAGGGIGSVTVNTDGFIRVVGDVVYLNAAAGDSLTFNGGEAIEVITDTGSISMLDSTGDVSGILVLNADNVWVGDQALINNLEADPNFAGRDAALATNNGPVVSDGYIQAGEVNATVSDSFFVQNSGTSTSYAGITVGDGGLDITNTGTDPLPVTVYGQQVKSDGTVVGGNNFYQAVSVAGGATTTSTANNCPLTGCVAPPPPPPPPPPEPVFDEPQILVSDGILGPLGSTDGNEIASNDATDELTDDGTDEASEEEEDSEDQASAAVDVLFSLINTAPVTLDETIDEPVTSGGDGGGPGGQ